MDWPSSKLPTRSTSNDATGSYQYTTVQANATADIYGSYATLVTATVRETQGFLVVITDSQADLQNNVLDIAIGGAGAEAVIVQIFFHTPTDGADLVQTHYVPFKIAAGTRIAGRVISAVAGSPTVKVSISTLEN